MSLSAFPIRNAITGAVLIEFHYGVPSGGFRCRRLGQKGRGNEIGSAAEVAGVAAVAGARAETDVQFFFQTP